MPIAPESLDGWIGALVAAALTVGATIWWDARTRQRERLDDAVLDMANAAGLFAEIAMRQRLGAKLADADATGAYRALAGSLVLVRSLALRKVLGLFPVSWFARRRWGLAQTVNGQMMALAPAAMTLPWANKVTATTIVHYAMAVQLTGHQWLQNPDKFWRGNRALQFLEQARQQGLGDGSDGTA